jgi:hypothetical protein
LAHVVAAPDMQEFGCRRRRFRGAMAAAGSRVLLRDIPKKMGDSQPKIATP